MILKKVNKRKYYTQIHKPRSQRLIESGLLRGWESLFIRTIAAQSSVSRLLAAKLDAIEAKLGLEDVK